MVWLRAFAVGEETCPPAGRPPCGVRPNPPGEPTFGLDALGATGAVTVLVWLLVVEAKVGASNDGAFASG